MRSHVALKSTIACSRDEAKPRSDNGKQGYGLEAIAVLSFGDKDLVVVAIAHYFFFYFAISIGMAGSTSQNAVHVSQMSCCRFCYGWSMTFEQKQRLRFHRQKIANDEGLRAAEWMDYEHLVTLETRSLEHDLKMSKVVIAIP